MWAPAPPRVLAGQYRPHKAFCRPWELGSAAPAHFLWGQSAAQGWATVLQGQRGLSWPHVTTSSLVLTSWQLSAGEGIPWGGGGPASRVTWTAAGQHRTAHSGVTTGGPRPLQAQAVGLLWLHTQCLSEAQGRVGPSRLGLGARDGPALPTGAYDGRCTQGPSLVTLLSSRLTHTHICTRTCLHTTHTQRHIYLHSHTPARTHTCTPACTCRHTCTRWHTHTNAREHTHLQTHVCSATLAHTCLHMLAQHTPACTHLHTHLHMCTRVCTGSTRTCVSHAHRAQSAHALVSTGTCENVSLQGPPSLLQPCGGGRRLAPPLRVPLGVNTQVIPGPDPASQPPSPQKEAAPAAPGLVKDRTHLLGHRGPASGAGRDLEPGRGAGQGTGCPRR